MQHAECAGRFRALDGLRGLFAVAVAGLHCSVYGYFYDLPLLRSAYLAVDFFFVLSGFVIAHATTTRLDSARSLWSFVVRRFGRVWPLHVVVLACFVTLELLKWLAVARGAQAHSMPFGTPDEDPLAIPAHLLLVHALHLFSSNTWNIPSWSISTEFYTYLLFGLCALTLRRWLVAVSLVLIVLSAWVLFRQVATMDTTYDWALPRCVYGFFVGYLVYRVSRRLPAPHAAGSLFELVLLIATALFMTHAARTQLSLLAPIVFAVPIWYFAFERGVVSRVLLSAPLQALGKWSYAIYLVHALVFMLVMRGFRALSRLLHADLFLVDDWSSLHGDSIVLLSFGQRWWMDVVAALAVALAVGLAYLANRFVEQPAQAYFQRLAKALETRPARRGRSQAPVLVAPARESTP